MLVLTRKLSERIHIGNDVVVMLIDIRGDKVRLGIDAPNDVAVHRGEVYEAIQRAQARIVDELPEPCDPLEVLEQLRLKIAETIYQVFQNCNINNNSPQFWANQLAPTWPHNTEEIRALLREVTP